MATKKKAYIMLYIDRNPRELKGGQVRGYREADGTVRHVARLYTDKGIRVPVEKAEIMMQSYDDIKEWTDQVAENVEALKRQIAIEDRRSVMMQRSMRRGPLQPPKMMRKPSREVEEPDMGSEPDDEPISEEEANNPLFNAEMTGTIEEE